MERNDKMADRNLITIRRETNPNRQNFRKYSVNWGLSFTGSEWLADHYDITIARISETAKLIAEEVLDLNGVEEIKFDCYTLTVQKNPSFDWESIEPTIVEELKKTFGPERERVEVAIEEK